MTLGRTKRRADGAGGRRGTRQRTPTQSSRCGAPTTTAPPARRRRRRAERAVRGFTRWNAADASDGRRATADRQRPGASRRPRRRSLEVAAALPGAGLRDARSSISPWRPARRPRRLRRRHVRHQGPRAAASCAIASRSSACASSPSISRPRASRRPRMMPSARSGAASSRRRARGVHRRPRQAVDRDGGRLRALRRDAGATSAASSRPAARAARRSRRRRMRAPADRHAQGDGLDRGLAATCSPTSARRDICMMYSVTDVPGSTASREQGARQRRPRDRRHDRPRRPRRAAATRRSPPSA